MKRVWMVLLAAALVGVGLYAYFLVHGINGLTSLQPGMIQVHLPSGATASIRRQSYFGKPAELYISQSSDFCQPYDSAHDYKLSDPIHGGAESPLLISYSGDTIIVHGPEKPLPPRKSGPGTFKVGFDQITRKQYEAYASSRANKVTLPAGWQRVEVPFDHNTCAL
jgi:hypothetical protein